MSDAIAKVALCRLATEYRSLLEEPPEGILAKPVSESNLFEWDFVINGPKGTCYEGGIFPGKLYFPRTYPYDPPRMLFTCNVFHPNISTGGAVCMSILHTIPDSSSNFNAQLWTPKLTIDKILLSAVVLLCEPNTASPANATAALLWDSAKHEYDQIVKTLMPTATRP